MEMGVGEGGVPEVCKVNRTAMKFAAIKGAAFKRHHVANAADSERTKIKNGFAAILSVRKAIKCYLMEERIAENEIVNIS